MFGERYFATRQRLTDVVIGVRELGNEVGNRYAWHEFSLG